MKIFLSLLKVVLLVFFCSWSLTGHTSENLIRKENSISKVQCKTTNQKITSEETNAEHVLKRLSLEEKIAQLFILVPEQLLEATGNVTSTDDNTKLAFHNKPVGGIIYMGSNLINPRRTKSMLKSMNHISYERIGLPAFLCVDEEGGRVARIANNPNFNVTRFSNMSIVGQEKNTKEAFRLGKTIGKYLSHLGFNTDFAPVADVLTNSANTVVKDRSFGSDAAKVKEMTGAVAKGFRSQGIVTSYKHFPGHGNTSGDTHNGYAYSNKTKDELYECELIPFIDAIKNNESLIMVGHISMPKLTGDDVPASLSKTIVTGLLRKELGYDGLIITDALNMGAIRKEYTSDEAAIKAIDAGVDILLVPEAFNKAYEGVLQAVQDGRISESRINESVMRIIKLKMQIANK